MVKIKTRKKMKLPELIEWCFKNDIRHDAFVTKECVGDQHQAVIFNGAGLPKFTSFLEKHHTFSVEVEEEITEDTKIPKLIEIGIRNLTGYSAVNENISINEITNKKSLVLYMLNDDYSMTPIWKKGKLVE